MVIQRMVVDLFEGDNVESFSMAKSDGLVGVIHKASEGMSFTDSKYAFRRMSAAATPLCWAAYHMIHDDDVNIQFDRFMTSAKPDKTMRLALDWEDLGGFTATVDQAAALLAKMDGAGGQLSILYGPLSFLNDRITSAFAPFFAKHPLWLAEYTSGGAPGIPNAWAGQKYKLWQYTDGTAGPQPRKCNGISGDASGNLDCNSWDGTADELRTWWNGTASPAVSVDPKVAAPVALATPWNDIQWPDLAPGGTARNAWVQMTLNKLYAPPTLIEDGINGPKTIAEVERFQKDHNLTVDGVVGDMETMPALLNAMAVAK